MIANVTYFSSSLNTPGVHAGLVIFAASASACVNVHRVAWVKAISEARFVCGRHVRQWPYFATTRTLCASHLFLLIAAGGIAWGGGCVFLARAKIVVDFGFVANSLTPFMPTARADMDVACADSRLPLMQSPFMAATTI